MKEYIKNNGEKSIYDQKKYDSKRNKEIWRLQRKKAYYKKKGDLEKVYTCQILINIEKRKKL